MKQTVLKNKFCQHYYDDEKKMMEQIWTNESESMITEDFKSIMLAYITLYDKHDIQLVLVDSREMRYLVEPEVQDWVNKNIIVKMISYLRKIAFLLSNDIFEEVSIKQAMDEQREELPFETKYFGDEQQARDWLL